MGTLNLPLLRSTHMFPPSFRLFVWLSITLSPFTLIFHQPPPPLCTPSHPPRSMHTPTLLTKYFHQIQFITLNGSYRCQSLTRLLNSPFTHKLCQQISPPSPCLSRHTSYSYHFHIITIFYPSLPWYQNVCPYLLSSPYSPTIPFNLYSRWCIQVMRHLPPIPHLPPFAFITQIQTRQFYAVMSQDNIPTHLTYLPHLPTIKYNE